MNLKLLLQLCLFLPNAIFDAVAALVSNVFFGIFYSYAMLVLARSFSFVVTVLSLLGG